MKAVILGTDLMYDQFGKLVPIEINTNVGYDAVNRVESDEEWLDLSSLVSFIKKKKFERVILDYSSRTLRQKFLYFKQKLAAKLPKIPIIGVSEDPQEITSKDLYIRIEFNEEALVDSYCRDKVDFLTILLKSSTIAQEFLYKEDGEVKGVMNDFLDNGPEKPNYVVKFRYPTYNVDYPKFYRLNSLDEVYSLVENLEDGYLIMPCYLNKDEMYEDRYKVLRQWSLLVPDEKETLKAINLGTYTKLSGKSGFVKIDSKTGEVVEGKEQFESKTWIRNLIEDVYLEKGDTILMSNGEWKAIEDVKVGDEILSLDVPHTENIDIRQHVEDYGVEEKEFEEESKFTVNEVKDLKYLEGFYNIGHLQFEEDQEEWWDTENSSYPTIDKEDGTVKFKEIKDFLVGDEILLVSLENESKVEYVKRTVTSISFKREFIEGYTLTVDGSHLFIAKSPDSTAGYVAIEHNAGSCTCHLWVDGEDTGEMCGCRCMGGQPQCTFVIDQDCRPEGGIDDCGSK